MNRYKNYKIYGNEIRFLYCPICGKEKENKDFSVDMNSGMYICFSTGQGGHIKQLKDFKEICQIIKECGGTYGKEEGCKQNMTKAQIKEKIENTDLIHNNLSKIIYDYCQDIEDSEAWKKYLNRRGIDTDKINNLLIHHCKITTKQYNNIPTNSLILPIWNEKSEIIGIKYRGINKNPLGFVKGGAKTQTNYFIGWQNISPSTKELIICEGEIDLLSLFTCGFTNAVSLPNGATSLGAISHQKEFLKKFDKIILALDNDIAGLDGQRKILESLEHKNINGIQLGKYKDINEVLQAEGVEKVREVINNAYSLTPAEKPFDKSQFYNGGKFLFNTFSVFLKEKHNIIKIDNELYIYKNGIYWKDADLEKTMIEYIPDLNSKQRKEVLQYLNIIADIKERNTQGLIAFKNGILNPKTWELQPFDTNIILIKQIPWDYNPTAYSKIMDDTLNSFICNDEGLRMLIEEITGYILYPLNVFGKAFIIVGDRANGKTTFLKILLKLVGEKNSSSLSLEDITNLQTRFRLLNLKDKLLNIGDDIGDGYIPDSKIFRNVVTGDIITGEKKGKDPINFSNYATLFFSANVVPEIKDPTKATERRLIILPFENYFTKENKNYNPFLLDELITPESMEYLIKIGIDGLKRLLDNGCFAETSKTKKLLDSFTKNNNPIYDYMEFVENENTPPFSLDYLINNFSIDQIYGGCWQDCRCVLRGYKDWSKDNGYKEVSQKSFINSMKTGFNLGTKRKEKNGIKKTYFVKRMDA